MVFNSLDFLLFFLSVFGLYVFVPRNWRWILMLVASCFFYMYWKAEYIVLILLPSVINYWAARQIYALNSTQQKGKIKFWLYFSIGTSLGILFVFKYFNFFNQAFSDFLSLFDFTAKFSDLNLLLPVGISFYTFQTLAYTVDVARGKLPPERNFGKFFLYVSFFPQLVAGPIERAKHLLPQLRFTENLKFQNFVIGGKLFLWGLFKKIVIADRLAVYVERVFSVSDDFGGLTLAVATVFFAFQIYCDFSGYSDMAIGVARIFGVKLLPNFRAPYFAKSIGEFWKRWHISLSTWFRDYVYIPLGGSRHPQKHRVYVNLFITFLVSGLWHGANWTFVIWGGLNGVYLVLERMTQNLRHGFYKFCGLQKVPFLHDLLKTALTFLLICVAWIFFRAQSLDEAFLILQKIFRETNWNQAELAQTVLVFSTDNTAVSKFLVAWGLILLLVCVDYFQLKPNKFLQKPVIQFVLWAFVVLLILVLGVSGENAFIYFQF